MSFILDALKKSESERQQQAPAAFATVPSSESGPRAPRWLWLLGGLLVINLIVLLGLILGSGDEPSGTPTTAGVTTDTSSPRSTAGFAEQIEAARANASGTVREVDRPSSGRPGRLAWTSYREARPQKQGDLPAATARTASQPGPSRWLTADRSP